MFLLEVMIPEAVGKRIADSHRTPTRRHGPSFLSPFDAGNLASTADLQSPPQDISRQDIAPIAEAIYRNLSGAAPVDVVVASTTEFERYRDAFCLAISPALREGRVICEARAFSADRSARMASAGAQQLGPLAYRLLSTGY
jgi:hypothetical protein